MAKVIFLSLIFAVFKNTAFDGVYLTGKKMELRPKENKTIFSDGAVMKHSSFTFAAERIIHYETKREAEAFGAVKIDSVDGDYSLRGEYAFYSIKSDTASVTGGPAEASLNFNDGTMAMLRAPRISHSNDGITAHEDARLNYRNQSVGSPWIFYDYARKQLIAAPLISLTFEDALHSAGFSADELIFLRESNKIKLISNVKGKIILK